MAAIANIGFIGLGAMGSAMARNLLTTGYRVTGFDLSEAARDRLIAAGGTAAASPRAAAEAADLVITMLPDAPDVEAALIGEQGILSLPSQGRLLMNCSTIDPAEARRLAAKAADAGWSYLDCAVGRTATQAIEGKCLFLLGGETGDKLAVGPVLKAMGDSVIDCGAVGQASAMKIVNNYLALVGCLATAEALMLARAASVKDVAALEVINGTSARNGNSMQNFPNKVLKGDVSPGFSLDLGRKDLAIAVAAMKREGLSSFLGEQALKAFDSAREEGHGGNDCTDLLNVLSKLSQRQGR